jgi:hypothetical protein
MRFLNGTLVLILIEGAMTAGQLAAIAAMQLTVADLETWMQQRSVNPAPPADAAAGAGRFAPPNGMNDEQRAAMRATAEANGFTFGSGRGAAGAGSGQLALMAGQVVELLAARAAE